MAQRDDRRRRASRGRFGQPGFLFLDPPDHTRLRKLVSKAFAPKVVKALEPDITALVDCAARRRRPGSGPFDVIADLAYPLPVAVICRLLGVPIEDEPQVQSCVGAARRRRWIRSSRFTGERPTVSTSRMQAGLWLREYLRDLIDAGAVRSRGTI